MAEVDDFIAASKVLTGYEALDANLANAYLLRLKAIYGAELPHLLAAATSAPGSDYSAIIANPVLRPVAAQIINIWFTGEFAKKRFFDAKGSEVDGGADTPTQEQYYSGLLWNVIRAHPPSHSVRDYGYWASPPPA